MATKHRLGTVGEELAVAFLEERGWQIIERNYRRKGIELDIIGRDPDRGIVFVEVRTRRSGSAGSAWESITQAKANRLRRGAATWLSESGIRHPVHLDAIAIRLRGAEAIVEHRKNLT